MSALPTWGSVAHGDEEHTRSRTAELTSLGITTRWIHGSDEHLEIGLVHGSPVLRSDEWLERENTGHGFDETSGHKRFAPGAGPALARAKLHSMHVEVSAPSADAVTLAASLIEDPGPP